MRILKVRKVGNSNVVSIPKEYEAAGFVTNADVALELAEDGFLYLRPLPADERKQIILSAVQAATKRHRRAMQILEEYDRRPDTAPAQR